jgi:hypothetical protein
MVGWSYLGAVGDGMLYARLAGCVAGIWDWLRVWCLSGRLGRYTVRCWGLTLAGGLGGVHDWLDWIWGVEGVWYSIATVLARLANAQGKKKEYRRLAPEAP